jgi:rRNA maturation endonuclease Nob1
MKRCAYCRKVVENESIDLCNSCGSKMWGNEILDRILKHTEKSGEMRN